MRRLSREERRLRRRRILWAVIGALGAAVGAAVWCI